MRDTPYARELASAKLDGCRIERLFVKPQSREEIRFSYREGGKMAMRPLDLPEEELLPLMRQAIEKGVSSDAFIRDLGAVPAARSAS